MKCFSHAAYAVGMGWLVGASSSISAVLDLIEMSRARSANMALLGWGGLAKSAMSILIRSLALNNASQGVILYTHMKLN